MSFHWFTHWFTRQVPAIASEGKRAVSSVGRALPRQGRGHWFKPSTAHVDEEVCGEWMPRKRTTCARGAGHPPGQHATAEAMENHRVRRRGRVRNDTPEVKAKWRLTHKLKRYGLTQDDFDRMLEEQDYACAMCPTLFEAGDLVFIDHDHTLGCHPGEKSACDRCRRGLLCLRCTVAVGYIEKYGVMARAYLEKTATPKPQRPEGRRLRAI